MLTTSYAAVNYFQYLFFYWIKYYLVTVLHVPEDTSRIYAAIPPLAMAAGMPLGGWLSDRLERASGTSRGRKIVPMAGMTAGAFCSSSAWSARAGMDCGWFALAMGAMGMSEGPFWATAVELGGGGVEAPRPCSTLAATQVGSAPVVTPWVGEHFGWGYGVALGGLICLAGVVLWLWIDMDGTRGKLAHRQ